MSDDPADRPRDELPRAALDRLRELREDDAYTSDLSTADFALCAQLGLRPLAQVMGSCVYQVGYQWGLGGGGLMFGSGVLTELETISAAWNEARARALTRLADEARAVGADAVIGVRLTREAFDTGSTGGGSGAIEYMIRGTAVRHRQPRGGEPAISELSTADYVNALRAGVEPLGIVASTAVFSTLFAIGGYMNYELQAGTQAIYAARARAMGEIERQAQRLGAAGVIGARVGQEVSVMERGSGGRLAIVTFHAIGTAVRDTAPAAPRVAPPLAIIDLAAAPAG